ncbi:MAG: DNA-directed RNA polymerase subunit K [Candidatus Heimdallarchaeota archaeon]|nr:DNA-directed RNA polymerase subunit K [Candidatus Heimdallarchaeota archaeon]
MSKKSQETKEIVSDEIVIGPPKLTRYEKARIIGARGLQISLGAPILIRLDQDEVSDPIKIAEKELYKRVLPLTISRVLPDGSYQNIPLVWLLEGEKKE